MKPVLIPALCALLVMAMTACGDSPQQQTVTSESPASPETAPASQVPSEADATDAGPAAENETTADSAAQLSEVDDDLETAGERAAASGSALPIRLAAATTPPASSKFESGKHYKTLVPAQPTDASPDEVEVVEVFWYGCGHCYSLDPLVESWAAKQKPPYVDFTRLPAMWNETLRLHARMFYTAEALGKLEELHPAIFRAIHVNGNMLNTPDKIRDFFAEHGVSPAEFDKAFDSFAVETKLKRADVLNRRYRVTSVPMVVVNGKYTTDVGSAGSPDELFELVNELAASEQGTG